MAELITTIRAGHVQVLYAYALDRLARDTEYALTLWNACQDQNVPIVVSDRRFDTSDSADQTYYTFLMDQTRAEGVRITKRKQDTNVAIRAHVETCQLPGRPHRGPCRDQMVPCEGHCSWAHSVGGIRGFGKDGSRPDENPAVVVQAFREAGSYLGAAKRLNDARVPTRRGGLWTTRSVMLVVEREAPELAPAHVPHRGVSEARVRAFSGLLVCHCGAVMTAHTRPGRPRADGSTGPSGTRNRVLHTYWRSVQLGPDLRPVAADWKLPTEYLKPLA